MIYEKQNLKYLTALPQNFILTLFDVSYIISYLLVLKMGYPIAEGMKRQIFQEVNIDKHISLIVYWLYQLISLHKSFETSIKMTSSILHLKFSLTVPGASKGSTVMNSDPISTIRPSLKPSVGWGTHTFLPPSMTETQLSLKVCWVLPPFLTTGWIKKFFLLFSP